MTASVRTPSPRGSSVFSTWLVFAFLVNAIAVIVPRLVSRPTVAYAAAFDVAVTVPVAYYVFVVRSGAQPALTIVPLGVLALLRALYVAPSAAALRPVFGALAELVVIAFLVARVRRSLRGGDARSDVIERVRSVATDMVRVAPVAEVLTSEIAVFLYAFGWRMKASVPRDARAFTVHRDTGVVGLFACMAGLGVMEALVVHVLLVRTFPVLAWVLTALSAYGTVWLVAVARSFALRPVLVTNDAVEIRSGLLATLRAPRSSIARVEIVASESKGDWRVVPASAPNVRVTFASPALLRGMYGITRPVSGVALAVDDPSGFVDALRAAPEASESAR